MSSQKKTKITPSRIKNEIITVKNNENVVQIKDSTQIILKDSLIKLTIPTKNKVRVKKQTQQQTQLHIKKINNDDKCDVITFTDGTQLEVVIEEIADNDVKYKKCNYKDGPSYRILKSKIKKIDLKNGEVYTPQTTSANNSSNGAIITSLVFGIIAFICLIIGIILVFTTGAGFSGMVAATALAPAGLFSLIGLIIASTQLKRNPSKLALATFLINLIIQILAFIFTILMFFI